MFKNVNKTNVKILKTKRVSPRGIYSSAKMKSSLVSPFYDLFGRILRRSLPDIVSTVNYLEEEEDLGKLRPCTRTW